MNDAELRAAVIRRFLDDHPGTPREAASAAADRYIGAVGSSTAESYATGGNPPITPDAFAPPQAGASSSAATFGTAPTAAATAGAPAGLAGLGTTDPADPGVVAKQATDSEASAFEDAVAGLGLTTNPADADVLDLLTTAGVDVDDPRVAQFIQNYGDKLLLPENSYLVSQLIEKYPSAPTTAYQAALQQSGFQGGFGAIEPEATAYTQAAKEGTSTTVSSARTKKFEEQPDTGWVRYSSGVLVDPETGQVHYDPTSSAPGSLKWQRENVPNWSDEKIAEWKKRLAQYGYISKDQAKTDGIDAVFLGALSSFHQNRYVNGGKPVASDLSALGAAGAASKPPLVDFEDMKNQIRSDVTEQFRRVMGRDPSSGELASWSQFVIDRGMTMQKDFRHKDYGSPSTMAAAEATEAMVSRLENSPQAEFLGDAAQENTAMRDALERSVMVTRSLAG